MRLSSPNLPDNKTFNAQNRAVKCLELSLVIPTYNERENIEELIVEICHVLDDVIEKRYEIIVVDDKSPDLTGDVVRDLSTQYPQVHLISRNRKKGLATAVVDGWEISQGKILGVIDGDWQHPPQTLKKLLRAIFEGADLAIASRYLKLSEVLPRNICRYYLSSISIFLAKALYPKLINDFSDPTSGFFLIRSEIVRHTLPFLNGYKILLEILSKYDLREVIEVSFTFKQRRHGNTKLTLYQCIEYLFCLFKLRCGY